MLYALSPYTRLIELEKCGVLDYPASIRLWRPEQGQTK